MKQRTWLTLAAVTSLAGATLPEASTVRAEEYYVNADAAPGGDGLTSATAFDSLDDITPFTSPALAAGDTIFVAGGTVNAYPAPVTAYSGVKLIGGVPPTGNPTQGFQNTGLYPTIIDASASNVGLFVDDEASPSTTIDGFVIENAGVFGIQNGNESQAAFKNLVLRNNGWHPLASASGAFNNGGDYAFATVTNCLFEDNFSISAGGGFSNPHKSSFRIERCTFRNNQSYYGGAISNAGEEVPTGCDPGPCDPQPIPIVRFTLFENNEAILTEGDVLGYGGAIYDSGDIKILASAFTANEARGDGGAIYSVNGRIILQDTMFVSNQADGDGGAIFIFRGCELSAYSCLFAKNLAARSGAIRATELNELILQNCTITENGANQWAGVYARVDVDACGPSRPFVADVQNCIIWHNGCDDDEVECIDYLNQLDVTVGSGGALTVDYNDIRNLPGSPPGGWGAHNIDADPQFIDPANLNWRIMATSPCIDSANGEVIPQDGEDTDGDSRTICGGCDGEDGGEHVPDLDLARRIVEVHSLTFTGLPPDDECPLECDRVPDMGAYERVACMDAEECAGGGDLNGDGLVNGLDIHPFTQCAILASAAEIACLCGDFSGPAGVPDGVVDWYDVPCFIELLLTQAHSCSGPILCGSELQAITDCNDNDIPDGMDIAFSASQDCNKNGVPDECDLESESSLDVNSNDIPDECETDCDGDTIPDAWAIAEELVADINENGIPDTCDPDCDADGEPDDYELTHGADDCNSNGVPDSCEDDCNSNGVPDDCDVDPLDPDGDESVSEDCNQNGIPDTCDLSRSLLPSFDCNDNQVPDECDIASEASEDANENGIPDECEEEFLLGGGESMMSGGEGGGEFDADAAWTEFFEWYSEQVFGDPGDWHTLSGPQRFHRVMDELAILGLPIAAPW